MLALVRDTTERKRAEDALLHQERELAVLEERNRFAREIHDTLAQGFTGIVLQLEAAEQILDDSPGEVQQHMARAKNLARESLQEARRSVWDLVPGALEQRALEGALQEEVNKHNAAGTENATFELAGQSWKLSSEVQAALYRICQESLVNVRRHSGATDVQVKLTFGTEAVGLEVKDNGIGFELDNLEGQDGGGFGLAGMRQRARLVAGSLSVWSRPGEGTLVKVEISKV